MTMVEDRTFDVFISHSSQDAAVGEEIYTFLSDRGFICFLASRNIPAGSAYPHELTGAINRTKLFILVLSSRSIESEHVLNEVDQAVQKKLPILPLRIELVHPSGDMEYY